MGQTLFTNVKIFDGNSKRSYAGEVLLQGNMVKKVAKGQRKIRANGADVIDGAGATLMPGLVESHSHVCYTDCVTLKDIGRVPVEEHMVIALENARLRAALGDDVVSARQSDVGFGERKNGDRVDHIDSRRQRKCKRIAARGERTR